MTDKRWKAIEREIAQKLGGKRNPLSSSNSRHTAGDVIHDDYFVECKYRKQFAAVRLHDNTARLAEKEDKIPLTILKQRNHRGFLVLINLDDFLNLTEGG